MTFITLRLLYGTAAIQGFACMCDNNKTPTYPSIYPKGSADLCGTCGNKYWMVFFQRSIYLSEG